MEQTIEVIVVDDHKLYRDGLASLLKDVNVVANEKSCDGKDFLERLRTNKFKANIVLLDVEMPNISGSEVLDIIVKEFPNMKAIITTQYDDDEIIKDFFNRGAYAYIPKGTDIEVLKDAIIKVNAGNIYKENLIELFKRTKQYAKSNQYKSLYSLLERIIIVSICDGKSVSEVAMELHICSNAVTTHLTNIYRKAEVKNRQEFLIYAINEGLQYLGTRKSND
jgi:DNA-binding NarL/FixJ family response regulator